MALVGVGVGFTSWLGPGGVTVAQGAVKTHPICAISKQKLFRTCVRYLKRWYVLRHVNSASTHFNEIGQQPQQTAQRRNELNRVKPHTLVH